MELRTWKLKVPKEQEQQVNKVLQERHKLKEAEVVLQFDEFDPFVQADPAAPAETLINNIYLHHSKCEEHWRNYLQGKFDKEEVKTLFSKLDFDKQGVVGLKQLVRELSILLDRHLRNRDLYRVFHRLTDDGQQFTCTQMLKVLGRKWLTNNCVSSSVGSRPAVSHALPPWRTVSVVYDRGRPWAPQYLYCPEQI